MKHDNESRQLRDICQKRGMYDSPQLNTVMWLNDLNLKVAPGLKEYSRLRCLHLENNSLSEYLPLGNLEELQSLFLSVCIAL